MTTDMQQEAAASVHDQDVVGEDHDPKVAAEEQAKQVLAKARYDAFRLVTEARTEAETILDEARSEAADLVTEAKLQAESIVDAARLDAGEVRAAQAKDTETTSAKQDAVIALEAEHEELTQRVTSLRAIADQLEERFAALAATAPSASAAAPTTPAVEAEAPVVTDVLDYSPSVPHPPKQGDADTPEAPEEKGSFYTRRSAKLPRIGEAGGKSALDMMRSIRETFPDRD